MYNDEDAAFPKDEAHFWKLVQDNFAYCVDVLEHYPLETREEALGKAKAERSAMSAIAYRSTSDGYDQREHFLELGRSLLPRVERLIRAREITPEFLVAWGQLMFCHGLIAGYVFDDSDDLGEVRRANATAVKKSGHTNRLKHWLASIHALPRFRGLSRKEADFAIADFLVEFSASPHAGAFPPKWFASLLTRPRRGEPQELRPKFARDFPNEEIAEFAARPSDGLPPLPIFPD